MKYITRWSSLALIVANCAAALVILWTWASKPPAVDLDKQLDYDSLISQEAMQRLGIFAGDDSQLGLVFLPSSAPKSPSWNYLTLLGERYRPRGMRLAVVKTHDDPVTDDSTVVRDDRSETIHHAFQTGSQHQHATVALVTRAGKVRFHSLALPSDDIMRQLVEKYAVGSVSFEGADDPLVNLFPSSGAFDPVNLLSIDSGGSFLLDSSSAKNATVLLVGAPCAPCQLSVIGRLTEALLRELPAKRDVIVIAAPHFDHELLQKAFAPVSGVRLFVISNSLPGYDRYITRSKDSDIRPWVVRTDANGHVIATERLKLT